MFQATQLSMLVFLGANLEIVDQTNKCRNEGRNKSRVKMRVENQDQWYYNAQDLDQN